jgi:hypothetical protein
MIYSKPEILVLGEASLVVQGSADKSMPNYDDSPATDPRVVFPAYDLDD